MSLLTKKKYILKGAKREFQFYIVKGLIVMFIWKKMIRVDVLLVHNKKKCFIFK